MDEDGIIRSITDAFPGVEVETASGDAYFYAGADRRLPFATLVTGDRHDAVSDLDRPGVFRLNVGVGRGTFEALFGPRAAAAETGGGAAGGHDFAALDTIMPHPVYGQLHWICVLSPSAARFEAMRPLLAEAYERAVARERKLRPGSGA